MAFSQDGLFVLTEYDGDDHYTDSLKSKADNQKDSIAQVMWGGVISLQTQRGARSPALLPGSS
jgi:hypothetical protein